MAEITRMDEAGLNFLIKEEGIVLHPYLDTVGVATIGVGCTYYESGKKVTMADPPITKERAILLFKNLLNNYELTVYSVTRDDINQNQFNALCSLCFNIGVNAFKTSTVVKKVNLNPNTLIIGDAFMMWKKPKELIPRRQREVKLYFS
jgi:lysozyme